jgi:uncharacterized alkaline shock family protein YloU
MKILERIALVLFSIIMIILAVTSCLVVFDIIELREIYKSIEELLKDDVARKVIIGSSIVSILLAIKSIFFPSRIKKKQEIRTGVLLENKDGRLLISKDTIENIVNGVVRSFDDAVDSQTKVLLDAENRITVFVSLMVKNDSIIKEMSSSMQTKIKETIKRNTDLDVSQVNINIKDVDNKNISKNNQTKIKVSNVQVNKKVSQEKETAKDENKKAENTKNKAKSKTEEKDENKENKIVVE